MTSKKFKVRLSEHSPLVKSSMKTNQKLLTARLTILEQDQRSSRRHHEHEYHRVESELRFSIQPRSIPLDQLDMRSPTLTASSSPYDPQKKQDVNDPDIDPDKTGSSPPRRRRSHGDLRVSTWIPGLDQTRQMTVRETGVGNKVFSMVKHSKHHTQPLYY